jgi:hypothetical protein
MADKKISALTASTTPLGGNEVLPIVQSGSTVKVSVADLTAGRNISTTGVTTSGATSLGLGVNSAITAVTIDSSSNVGVGASSPLAKLDVRGNLLVRQADASFLNFTSSSTVADIEYSNTGAVRFVFNGVTETMRISSTGNITAATGNLVLGTAGKGIDFSANTHAAGMTSELLNDYEEGTFTPALAVASGSLTSSVQGTSQYIKIGRLVTASGYINVSSVSLPSGALTITGLPYAANNFTAVTLSLFTGGFTQAYSGYVSSASTTISIPNLNASIMVGGENVMFTATYQTT